VALKGGGRLAHQIVNMKFHLTICPWQLNQHHRLQSSVLLIVSSHNRSFHLLYIHRFISCLWVHTGKIIYQFRLHPLFPGLMTIPVTFKYFVRDLKHGSSGNGDWMGLAQDRDRWRALVSTVMNLRVPKMRGISWLDAETVSFSRRTLLHGVSK